MGDWAKGEFTAAGQKAGQEYGCTILSDRGTTYAVGGDVVVFPRLKAAAAQRAQALLEKVLTNLATQVAFSAKKGSIPARLDADVSGLDECARKAHAWVLDPAAQVPANELLAPPSVTGAVEDVVSQYWNNLSMSTDELVQKITAALT